MEGAFGIILIGVAAFLLPILAARIRVPAFVVEMLFGIAVGPQVLGWLDQHGLTAELAELGFFMLMFLSGFEIDFGKLERQGPGQILTGLAVFGVTLAAAGTYAFLAGFGFFMTFVLATTSVGLVVPTLRATRTSSSPLGQAILICALLADFLTLVGVAVYAIFVEHGFGVEMLSFPALLLAILALLLGIKRIAWWFPERFERFFAADDPEELGIRASLALMFVCVGLSYLLEIEAILGAFLAGAVFAMVFRHRGQLEQKLTGFAFGFFVPIFFIHVGARFDIQAILGPGVIEQAVGLVLAAIGVKLAAAAVLFLRGFSPREVLAAGVILSARLSLIIAVAELGVRLGLIGQIVESQAILLALLSAAFAPAVFKLLIRSPSE